MRKSNHYTRTPFIVIVCLYLFLGCNKSDDSEEEGTKEIKDNSILNGDVNAPDFWDGDNLVWNDEFDGTQLSSEKWVAQKYISGVGNTELQRYTGVENLEVSDGSLKIKVLKTGPGQESGDYTSGRLTSKFIFTYGRVEMRAKLPAEKGNGLWAKLWLLGSNFASAGFPKSGNIDMLSYVSNIPNQFFSTAITAANFNNNTIQAVSDPIILETVESAFHNYGILWTDKYIKFYVDDVKNVTFTYLRPENKNEDNWPFDKPFYFVINVAVGGAIGGVEGVDDAVFPTQMEIDYVRVYHGKK